MRTGLYLESGTLVALAAAALLCASACGSGTPESRIFRGFAVHGHEVRSFRPCGSDEALWAIDPQGTLWEVHNELVPHREPYEEVFAVVVGRTGPAPTEGLGAEYPGRLDIDEVLHVAWEGFGCDTDWSAFDYRAYGNEPFWNVELSAARLRLNRLGSESRTWTDVRERTVENGVRFEGDEPPIELTLVREPCRDSMSGAYFAMSARLVVGAEVLRGCALPGITLNRG
jgi:putative lipoprotein